MKITKKHIAFLASEGLDADAHHATIRSAFKGEYDHKLSKDELQTVRDMLGGDDNDTEEAKKEKPEPTQEELMKEARAYLREIGQKPSRVVEVTDVTAEGNPARLVIKCIDPQEDSDGNSVCAETREVAIQDVFQVQRCIPCQKRSVQLYRNRLARQRRREHKKLLEEQKS